MATTTGTTVGAATDCSSPRQIPSWTRRNSRWRISPRRKTGDSALGTTSEERTETPRGRWEREDGQHESHTLFDTLFSRDPGSRTSPYHDAGKMKEGRVTCSPGGIYWYRFLMEMWCRARRSRGGRIPHSHCVSLFRLVTWVDEKHSLSVSWSPSAFCHSCCRCFGKDTD